MKLRLFLGAIYTCLIIVGVAMLSRAHVAAIGCGSEPSLATNGNAFHWNSGTASTPHVINVFIDSSFTSSEQLEASQGIQSWIPTLTSYNIAVNFVSTDPGQGSVDSIRIVPNSSPQSDFGYTVTGTDNSDAITGATISINRGAVFAGATSTTEPDYDPTQIVSSAPFFTGTIAHEFGHALGLAETGEQPCHATSPSVMGPACGTNNQGDGTSPPDPTSTAPTGCDKNTVATNISNPKVNGTGGTVTGGGGGGFMGGGSGTGGGSGPSVECCSYEEWDDQTNTLTEYAACTN